MNTASDTNSAIPSIIDMGSITIPIITPRLEQLANLLDQVSQDTPTDSTAHATLLKARALLQDIQAEALIQVADSDDDPAAVVQHPAEPSTNFYFAVEDALMRAQAFLLAVQEFLAESQPPKEFIGAAHVFASSARDELSKIEEAFKKNLH